MNVKNNNVTLVVGMLFLVGGTLAILTGCRSAEKDSAAKPGERAGEAKHEAHHGGCLNAIETCAVGHAEVKLEGTALKVWFVGGETETDKAVRVSDKQIVLAVKPEDGAEKSLTLEAKPSELAEEKVGDCSHFEGKADWLAGVKKFTASGQVNLKGKVRPIKIEYPDGYDPDDAAEKKPGGTSK